MNILNSLVDADALKQALLKLAPQHMIKNPVMALVWLGTLITLIATVAGWTDFTFGFIVTLLLLLTVLFSNYAEAVAEARGRGQAASLRQARQNLMASELLVLFKSKIISLF
jgi:K+-transporting ATPase ATPase B chain